MNLPLEGITVLEFAQFLAGPSAGLRLADFGARVIKIERPKTGEAGRQIAIKHLFIDGDSLVFHTINRNKQSYAADLKNPNDLAKVRTLIAHADVMTHNFRPGVIEKLGLDYPNVSELNPRIVYGEVTGYGRSGPWKDKPGQDLLVQSLSGLTWLSGNRDQGPVPMGLSVADNLCACAFHAGNPGGADPPSRDGEGRLGAGQLAGIDSRFAVRGPDDAPCRQRSPATPGREVQRSRLPLCAIWDLSNRRWASGAGDGRPFEDRPRDGVRRAGDDSSIRNRGSRNATRFKRSWPGILARKRPGNGWRSSNQWASGAPMYSTMPGSSRTRGFKF